MEVRVDQNLCSHETLFDTETSKSSLGRIRLGVFWQTFSLSEMFPGFVSKTVEGED